MLTQMRFEKDSSDTLSYDERVCSKCMGHRALCGIRPCPLVMRAKAMANIDNAVTGLSLAGSSPPSTFVGESGYPKVIAGPLVPPVIGNETFLMERPDLWLDKTMDEILGIRFSLVRMKRRISVDAAMNPPRILAETQTLALSEAPTASEAVLLKRPTFASVLSGRTLPIGPSAPLDSFRLEDNPKVPKSVDRVTSDTDLRAGIGILDLYDAGIRQGHLTRLFSIGLMGQQRLRRLVPTKWSITAVDDIIGRQLHKQVLGYRWLNDFEVYADHALGNDVVLLFLPSAWQFEAMECWLGGVYPTIISDHEWFRGRKDYARDVVGAYYATRLPTLERLVNIGRQAGVIAFLETDPQQWVPMGVWRFREIARRALSSNPKKYSTLDEAITEVDNHLRNPVNRWLQKSHIYKEYLSQTQITDFL